MLGLSTHAIRLAGWVVGCVLVAGGLINPGADAAPKPEQSVAVNVADFNGDGYGDLALTGSDDSGEQGRSLVRIMYGGDIGLSVRRMQSLVLEELVEFGQEGLNEGYQSGRLTSGDFDGDGYTDLAIGIPGLKVGGAASAGGVLLLRGSKLGLETKSRRLITQASPGVPDRPEEEDGFGSDLAAGNLGRGPEDDLIVGVPAEDLSSGVYDGGQVHVFFGSADGIDPGTSQMWRQSSPGIEGRAGDSDNWGSILVTGNFDGSAYDDLAIGNPGDHYHETYEHGAGTLQVLYGTTDGLTASGSQRWSAAMPALANLGHVYGLTDAIAAGDFDADGRDDLALASGGNPVFEAAGSVTILYGSPTGVSAARAQTWSQNSVGIAGEPEESEGFGVGLVAGSFGRDSGGRTYDDLAVGVRESVDAPESGGVHIIFGGPAGLTGSRSQFWSQSSLGVPGVSEEGDNFGDQLAAGDFGRNPRGRTVEDLAIGAPFEVIGDSELSCSLTVIYGNDGLTSQASRRWTPVDFGVPANGFGYFPENLTS